MATYANHTNPFIKPNNGAGPSAGARQQSIRLEGKEVEGNSAKIITAVGKKKKDALPGMARLQNNNETALAGTGAKGGGKRNKRRAASKKKDESESETTNELIDINLLGEDTKVSTECTGGGSIDIGHEFITDARIGLTMDENNNNSGVSNGPPSKSGCTQAADLNELSKGLTSPSSSSSILTENISREPLDVNDSATTCNERTKVDVGNASCADDGIAEQATTGVTATVNKSLTKVEETLDSGKTDGLIELALDIADVKLDDRMSSGSDGVSVIRGLKSDKSKRAKDIDAVVSADAAVIDVISENGRGNDVDSDDNDDEDEDDETLRDDSVDINSLETDQVESKPMEQQDSRRHQHTELIKKLRLQLRDLERFAYERGELEQVPPSVLAERQSVILEMLKRKLPLNTDKDRIEKLELEELKSQVDKEISDLIDPLITKDHLLKQLKTQLTDLERYISHLHETIGKNFDKSKKLSDCSCQLHGCSTPKATMATFKSLDDAHNDDDDESSRPTSILSEETLPKTSRLIRGLMAQLICSDMKIQEAMKGDKDFSKYTGQSCSSENIKSSSSSTTSSQHQAKNNSDSKSISKAPQFHDATVWTMHIDKVLLATDSLTNLFAVESRPNSASNLDTQCQVDESLVESVVRRQLVPAIRDLLTYGLIDPNQAPRATYRSFLFDPYYLISSFTCLPGSQSSSELETSLSLDKIHPWNVIEDYFKSRIEPEFKNSSIKTLSQSFNLTPSMNGPLRVTSKQALLIAVDDIRERLAQCKPNGPESHFKLFVYTALNQAKLATWIRLVFRNKSILKKYYHNFSFTNQSDKMDKFLSIIEALGQIEFKLNVDTESDDQFVSAF